MTLLRGTVFCIPAEIQTAALYFPGSKAQIGCLCLGVQPGHIHVDMGCRGLSQLEACG